MHLTLKLVTHVKYNQKHLIDRQTLQNPFYHLGFSEVSRSPAKDNAVSQTLAPQLYIRSKSL